jgi:tetratricopeptide (TPR) repeat protein
MVVSLDALAATPAVVTEDGAELDLETLIAAVEADLDGERYQAAIARIAGVVLDDLPASAWERLVATALRCRIYGGEPIDRVIVDARRLLPRARPGKPRAMIHAEIAFGLATKRVERLARAAAADVDDEWPEGSLGPAIEGWIGLQFDRRDDAVAAYQRATERLEPHRGWMGLARVRYVTGDFDGALAALAQVGDQPRTRAGALRMRADIARIRGEWPSFLERVEAILAATPGGDHRRGDLLDRASALFALGRRDDGLEVYRALWREDEADSVGRFAREVLNTVEREQGAGGRLMLPRFPTVAQKRNYCGPATLELVLRSLGIDVGQDDIAPQVKKETGSSVLAMTRYLESHGLVTRRFEGDAARFRTCVELGLPVIVEEEYSTTSHVAVVIGIDDGLGLLFVQDPMTHVTSERLIKTQGTLGAMYRNAAIVAIRPDDTERAAVLDRAGVLDQAHLRLVDSCADDELALDNEEVLRRCDRALALVEDYPLAWNRRTQALLHQMFRFRTANNGARFVSELRKARVRYHDQEWPHLLHATYLMDDSRHEEALIELETALRLDPQDSNTAQDIAECHMQLQRRDEATAAFWKTLGIDPTHVRATENFAGHALDGGDLDLAAHLSACALEMSPQNPFNYLVASRTAAARGELDAALGLARRAVEVNPDYVHGHLHLARQLAARGDDASSAEATRIYLELTAKHPYWFEPRGRAARRLELAGRAGEAVELLLAGLEIAQDEPVELLRHLTDILLEAGDDDEAVSAAERFAGQRPTVGMLEVLWDTLDAADRTIASRDATATFLASNDRSPFACAQHAARITGLGEDSDREAERLLRIAVTASPTYGHARRQLAELLVRDRPDEAVALLRAAPPGDAHDELLRASLLADLGRFADARAAMATVPDDGSWPVQEVWNRVVLGADGPAAARDRLGDEPRDHRARLAFSLALRDDAAVGALFAGLPAGDVCGQLLAVVAADADDRWRDELERRIAARLAVPSLGHVDRRYLAAVRAGNDAARGDRAALDRLLASERNLHRLADAIASLHQRRQRDLVLEVREALAARPDRAAAAAEGARAAAMRGQHGEAIRRARAAIEHFPRSPGGHAVLAVELAMVGKERPAAVAAEAGLALPAPWVDTLEAAALTALLSGEIATARERAERASRKAVATGYGDGAHNVLAAVRAALAGDPAGVERARDHEDLHVDPASRLWTRLMSIAGR